MDINVQRYINISMANYIKPESFNFKDSLYMYGIYALYKKTKNMKFFNFVYEYYDELIDETGVISGYKYEDYNLDAFSLGFAILDLYEETREYKFRSAVSKIMSQINHQPLLKDLSYAHSVTKNNELWAKDIFSCLMYFTKFIFLFHGRIGSRKELELRIKNIKKNLYIENKKLYTPFYFEDENGMKDINKNSDLVEATSLAYLAFTMVNIYEMTKIKAAKELFLSIYDGIKPYLIDNKLPLIPDQEIKGNYNETTSNLLLASSFMKAKKMNLLKNENLGFDMFEAIKKEKFNGKTLKDVIEQFGTDDKNFDNSQSYVLKVKKNDDDLVGIFALIFAYIETTDSKELFK